MGGLLEERVCNIFGVPSIRQFFGKIVTNSDVRLSSTC